VICLTESMAIDCVYQVDPSMVRTLKFGSSARYWNALARLISLFLRNAPSNGLEYLVVVDSISPANHCYKENHRFLIFARGNGADIKDLVNNCYYKIVKSKNESKNLTQYGI
jgi:hypothetical protein